MQALPNLGFITVVQEAGPQGGFVGGYLAANAWGRPLEFRLTTSVQPTRVQQILYGPTLRPYLFADLIGKTLLEKSSVSVQAILCDCEELLEMRRHVGVPVAWVTLRSQNPVQGVGHADRSCGPVEPEQHLQYVLKCHPRFSQDEQAVQQLLKQIDFAVDLTEPFSRIREALSEARRAGATSRAA